MMEINHDIQARNTAYTLDSLGEDIKFSEDILREITMDLYLDKLRTRLNFIRHHLNGEENNSQKFLEVTQQVRHNWLEHNLVSHIFNGGIYSTDSARQSRRFIGEGINDVGSALGFLIPHAKQLGVESRVIDKMTSLPHVDLWLKTLFSYLTARIYVEQTSLSLNSRDQSALQSLEQIAHNTLLAVSELSKHRETLFLNMQGKYANAIDALQANMIKKIELELKNEKVSLRTAIEKGWINFNGLGEGIGECVTNKLRDHERTAEIEIPLIVILGLKLGLISANAVMKRTNNTPGASWDGQNGYRHHINHRLRYRSATFHISLVISNGEISTEFISTEFSKNSSETGHHDHRSSFEGCHNNTTSAINQENALSDVEFL